MHTINGIYIYYIGWFQHVYIKYIPRHKAGRFRYTYVCIYVVKMAQKYKRKCEINITTYISFSFVKKIHNIGNSNTPKSKKKKKILEKGYVFVWLLLLLQITSSVRVSDLRPTSHTPTNSHQRTTHSSKLLTVYHRNPYPNEATHPTILYKYNLAHRWWHEMVILLVYGQVICSIGSHILSCMVGILVDAYIIMPASMVYLH